MDAIFGFIRDNAVILGLVLGLAMKYQPALKWVPNEFIPYINGIIVLLAKIFGPPDAQAATGAVGATLGFLAPVVSAGWSAIQSALIYEIFGRHPLEKRLGWRKA